MIINKNHVFKAFVDMRVSLLAEMVEELSIGPNPAWGSPENAKDLLSIEGKPKYIFAGTVKDTLHTIKIKDKFDCNVLLKLKKTAAYICIDHRELFIYALQGNHMRIAHMTLQKRGGKIDQYEWYLFKFDITDNAVVIGKDAGDFQWQRFLRCLIYLEFLPTEFKYINANQKYNTRDRHNKIINKTNHNFILVTKAWNYEYRTKLGEKFYSAAHWGIRWTGKGRTTPSMVFVKGSMKQRTQKAGKDKIRAL